MKKKIGIKVFTLEKLFKKKKKKIKIIFKINKIKQIIIKFIKSILIFVVIFLESKKLCFFFHLSLSKNILR